LGFRACRLLDTVGRPVLLLLLFLRFPTSALGLLKTLQLFNVFGLPEPDDAATNPQYLWPQFDVPREPAFYCDLVYTNPSSNLSRRK
jgi:hypothetical protein